jgi:multiple sugar transport system permease protein
MTTRNALLKYLRRLGRSLATYSLVGLVCLWTLTPFLWLVTSSVRPSGELFVSPPRWIPEQITLRAYETALRTFAQPLLNSVVYGAIASGCALLFAVPAAYSLVRYRYAGKWLAVAGLVASQLLPFVLILLPLYVIFVRLGLYNTRVGLIVAYTGLTLPFSILVLRSYFATHPPDLEEQAMVDGCTRIGALWRIVLPLAGPAIVATGLLSTALVWNDVLVTVFLSSNAEVQTASVALYNLFNTRSGIGDPTVLFAGGVLITLPIVGLFALLQRWMVQSIALAGLK